MIKPIDVILFCPTCDEKHIDAPDPKTSWTNPPHRSHLCKRCKTIWRPSDHYTNGVEFINTRGEHDTIEYTRENQ